MSFKFTSSAVYGCVRGRKENKKKKAVVGWQVARELFPITEKGHTIDRHKVSVHP